MRKRFKVGDHVTWNSEAGHVSGTIIKVHTKDIDYMGHNRSNQKLTIAEMRLPSKLGNYLELNYRRGNALIVPAPATLRFMVIKLSSFRVSFANLFPTIVAL